MRPRVKVFDSSGGVTLGAGIFAREIHLAMPWLPVVEENRLNTAKLRDNFVLRVHVYCQWQQLPAQNLKVKHLVEFHARHKFLMAHHPSNYRTLGHWVANTNAANLRDTAKRYFTLLMAMLQCGVAPTSRLWLRDVG